MSQRKDRRKWTPKEKLRIVLESMQSDQKLSEICRREGLNPTLVYQWRKQLLASAEMVYTPKRDRPFDRTLVNQGVDEGKTTHPRQHYAHPTGKDIPSVR